MLWVYAANDKLAEEAVAAYEAGLSTSAGDIRHFRNSSTLLSVDGDKPLSAYAEIEESPRAILVGARHPVMVDTPFALAWLAGLARRAEVVLHDLPAAPGLAKRLTAARLGARADLFVAEPLSEVLTRLTLAPAAKEADAAGKLDAYVRERLKTAAFWLGRNASAFCERYLKGADRYFDGDRLSANVADGQFCYTMHGVFQKGLFLDEWIRRQTFAGADLNILDMGGGYGGLGVEMAVRGHAVTVVELEDAKIELLGRWLARSADVASKVTFRTGDFSKINTVGGPFDLICFFGSLLYEDRAVLPKLLADCAARLTQRGRLIVQELPQSRSQPDARDFQRQFTGEELHAALSASFKDIRCFSPFNLQEIPLEKADETVLLCEAAPK